jgi:hypothetical protein
MICRNEENITSILDGSIEPVQESISDYEYPKAKRSYKMKVRISGRSKGQPMDFTTRSLRSLEGTEGTEGESKGFVR